MQNKLQELTDKLYNEGLSKGKAEGEQLLADARKKADEIVEKAKADAAQIKAKAESDVAELRKKAESDVKMASEQSLQATRKDIENMLVNSVVAGKTGEALSDVAFVKEIIKAVAEKFSATESADLAMVLPAKLQKELEPWVAGELAKSLKGEVKAEFSKKISGGFTIGPKDGSYFINMSDASFNELIAEYMRPVTRKLLFGE